MKAWAERFYNGKAWRSCRRLYLDSIGHLCERCSTKYNPVPAKIVHHKKALTQENITDINVTLNHANLEALCQTCHNQETFGKKEPERYKFDSEGRVVPIQ